jgi:YidC/Oxa1 family membrane protein insertase
MQASITTPIGKIFQPVLDAVGGVLAFFYSIIPNYPIDVALLTIVIMALLTPLTVKSTKNMAAMQALGPEMKKLQQKYKGAENRAQRNEEMMKLYKEHNVNPASGCLPMLLQMPAFFVLYSVVRGITNTVTVAAHTVTKGGLTVDIPAKVTAVPRYIPKDSKMYHNIVAPLTSQLHIRGHPLPLARGGLSRSPIPPDVQAERKEQGGCASKSPGGNASEIYAAYLWVYLYQCCCNSECLFHSFERNSHSDPRDPVQEGHGRGTPQSPHRGHSYFEAEGSGSRQDGARPTEAEDDGLNFESQQRGEGSRCGSSRQQRKGRRGQWQDPSQECRNRAGGETCDEASGYAR